MAVTDAQDGKNVDGMAPKRPRKTARRSAVSGISPSEPACNLCHRPGKDDLDGELLCEDGLHVHHFCLLFSSGLLGTGPDTSPLRGFLPQDVRAEIRRASRLVCSLCGRNNATIGCIVKTCRRVYHRPCAVAHGCQLQYFQDFRVYCPRHRQEQQVTPLDPSNRPCPICAEDMVYPSLDVLVTPCCRQLFHHHCIQRQALNAGSHFFRCGNCNNEELFRKEMAERGIYIPEQDASWEQEPNAYRELLFRYSHCDAPRCGCPGGRGFSKPNSIWELVVCTDCGSQGSHALCSNVPPPALHWRCTTCRQVATARGKAGGNGGAATSPAVADNGGKVASVIYINSSDDEDDEQMHWVPSKKRPPGKPGLCSHTASRWQLLAGRGSHQVSVGGNSSGESSSHCSDELIVIDSDDDSVDVKPPLQSGSNSAGGGTPRVLRRRNANSTALRR